MLYSEPIIYTLNNKYSKSDKDNHTKIKNTAS